MSDIFENDIFKDFDPYFLNKIKETITSIGSKPDIEIIGTFMALSNEANNKGIVITPEQQEALILFLRNELPKEKRQKFDLIISMIKS